jgi:hypothetical protein
MKKICGKDIIDNLVKYKEILKVIEGNNLKEQISDIDKIINSIDSISDICLDDLQSLFKQTQHENKINTRNKSNKAGNKVSFQESINFLENKEFEKIKGIKLDYDNLYNSVDIIKFVEDKSKSMLLKSATALDLKLLYFLLTGNRKAIKKNKEELYNYITSYIKAKKQGQAFGQFVK